MYPHYIPLSHCVHTVSLYPHRLTVSTLCHYIHTVSLCPHCLTVCTDRAGRDCAVPRAARRPPRCVVAAHRDGECRFAANAERVGTNAATDNKRIRSRWKSNADGTLLLLLLLVYLHLIYLLSFFCMSMHFCVRIIDVCIS